MTRTVLVHPLTGAPVYVNVIDPPPKAAPPKATPSGLSVVKMAEAEVDGKGAIVAKICKMGGPPDYDGDIITPGAFGPTPQETVMSTWQHSAFNAGHAALPCGVGIVRQEGEWGVFRGKLLDTTAGIDVLKLLRAIGGRAQFSWGYAALAHHFGTYAGKTVRYLDKLAVDEVSPVLRASSLGTALVHIDGRDDAELAREAARHEGAPDPREGKRKRDDAARRDLAVEIERARGLGIRV